MYDLPKELLATLSVKSHRVPAPSETTEASHAPSLSALDEADAADRSRENGTPPANKSCALCQVTFNNVEEHREHARSDHHRYNLKAQLRGARTLTEAEFAKAIGELDESISGSEDSDEDDEEDDEEDPEEEDGKEANGAHVSDTTLAALLKKQARLSPGAGELASSGSIRPTRKQPLVWFSTPLLPANTSLGVYRALFSLEEQDEPGYYVDSLKRKQLQPTQAPDSGQPAEGNKRDGAASGPHIFMCMVGGGHFAAMVVALAPEIQKRPGGVEQRQARVLAHKTFHRYTTRRKQGGSQAANDAAKGNAHSAGSNLRRYNEAALEKDIRELLREWKPMIDSAELLFVRAPGSNNRRIIFGPYDGQVLRGNDPRLRGFPFSTRRATQSELMRCFKELTRVKVSQIDEAALAAEEAKKREVATKSPKPPTQPKKPKLSEEEEAALLHTSQIQGLIRRSKIPALLSYISNNSIPPSFKFFPPDSASNHHAPTPLHMAANTNSPALVNALLIKARFDPTVTNNDGKTPFDLARDRDTRDAFRVARHELGESAWDWEAAHVPSPISRAEVESRQEQERQAAAAEEAARRKAETERLRQEEAARAASNERKQKAGGRTLAAIEKTAAEKREEEMRGMTPEMRMRLERERRARAAEERIRRMQQGK